MEEGTEAKEFGDFKETRSGGGVDDRGDGARSRVRFPSRQYTCCCRLRPLSLESRLIAFRENPPRIIAS